MLANGDDTKDMPPMEYLGNLLLLIVGGNDTTPQYNVWQRVWTEQIFLNNLLSWSKNPGLIPQMVAEIIRWQNTTGLHATHGQSGL